MAGVDNTRKRLTITFIVLGVLDVLALVLLFSPLIGSSQSRLDELDNLRAELQQKQRQVEPLRGLDKKVVVAEKQISEFYDSRLPERDSVISEDLGRLADQTGVKISQVKYTQKDALPVGLRPMLVEATFSGGYLQLVRFINSLEREQLFFIVDGVDFGGDQQGDTVRLNLKLRTYLRAGA